MAHAATVVACAAANAARRSTGTLRTHARDVARLTAAVAFVTPAARRRRLGAVTRHMSSLVAAEARLWHSLIRAARRDVALLTAVVAA